MEHTASPAGLTINSTTGAITPSTSTAGTYTVTYDIPASGMSFSRRNNHFGNNHSSANGNNQLCRDAIMYRSVATAVTVTGTGAAVEHISSPAGLTINSATGAITPSTSTAGTYTVTYMVPASGFCPAFVVTTSVQSLQYQRLQ